LPSQRPFNDATVLHTCRIITNNKGKGMGRRLCRALIAAAALQWAIAACAQPGFPPEPGPPQDATIGRNAGTPLTGDYRLLFTFTGTPDSVTFDPGLVQPMQEGN
jgi:hypothetical protein